eukprot:scpid79577/ scgid21466/ 
MSPDFHPHSACSADDFRHFIPSYTMLLLHLPLPPHSKLSTLPQAGQLQYFQASWHTLTTDPWVLETVFGYRLDLLSPPTHPSVPHPHRLDASLTQKLDEEVCEVVAKGAITQIPEREKGIFQSIFRCAEGGFHQNPADYQPPSPERLSAVSPLQDGVIEDSGGSPAARRCDDQDRLERCLFLLSSGSIVSSFSPVPVTSPALPV